jgi:ribosomal protein L13E
MTDSAELRVRLEAGIAALESDLDRLRAALTALNGHNAPAPRQSRRRTARRRPGRSADSAPAPQVAPAAKAPDGKLTKLLDDGNGLSTAELAKQMSGAPDKVLRMLKELEQAGRAHRTGNRRSTRWHAGRAPRRGR